MTKDARQIGPDLLLLAEAARLYRLLILLLATQLGFAFLRPILRSLLRDSGPAAQLLSATTMIVVLVGLVVSQALAVYRLGRRLGTRAVPLLCVFILVPCANLIVVALLNARLAKWCARYSIECGPLGMSSDALGGLRVAGTQAH